MDELSKYLADQIAFLDEEQTAEELADAAAYRQPLLDSVEKLYHSPETTMFMIYGALRAVTSKLPRDVVKTIADSAVWCLDDCFSRVMVSEIPNMVSRALKLQPVMTDKQAQVAENTFIQEATRCYIFGLFLASVALSRSALEHALQTKCRCSCKGSPRRIGC